MKRILIVTYDWVPRGSVGIIRIARFAKYLVRAGYDVHVITRRNRGSGNLSWDRQEPEFSRITVYEVDLPARISFLSRLMNRINPQLEVEWFQAVKGAAPEIFKEKKFDVVLSSSPPESSHLIALYLKDLFGIPWIADLRDLWVQDHYRNFDPIRKAILSFNEKKILSCADRIVTVTETWAESLGGRYGDKVRVVTNGYDEDAFGNIAAQGSGKFVISYLGKLNAAHQDISVFLNTVKGLTYESAIPRGKLEVNFYISGYGKPDIRGISVKEGLSDIVHEHRPVPLGKALAIMKSSSLLLLVGWKGPSSGGWRPQKVYEYLGSGTPVMLVNGSDNNEIRKFIDSTGCGSIADDAAAAKDVILKRYREFKDGKIAVNTINRDVAAKYTAANVTGELCKIIEGI